MKRRRILAALLALVMVLSTTTAIFAKDWSGSGTFEDVGKNDWFHGYVENLAAQKIVKGYGKTDEYRPTNTLSREEAAKMIAEAAGLTASPDFKSSFIDLDDIADWALPYVYALEEAGVIKGFGDTDEFRPKLPIERGHIAKMLVKAFGLEEGPVPVNLSDLDLVEKDPEVLEAIRILASNGIVSGFGTSNEFRPLDDIDRAAFAKVIAIAQATAAVQQAEKDDATPEDIERAKKLVGNLPDDQDKETKESLEERLDELEEEEDEPGPGPVDPEPIPVSAISVTGEGGVTTITEKGGTLQMIATVQPDTATDDAVTWSVENGTGSATISDNGLLTAVTNGTVTVKATSVSTPTVSGTKVITISGQLSSEKEITGFTPLTAVTLNADENLVDLAALIASSKLPTEVTVTDGETPAQATISDWTGDFDGTAKTHTLTATWTMPEGYADATDPITVTVDVIVEVAQTEAEAAALAYINSYMLTNGEYDADWYSNTTRIQEDLAGELGEALETLGLDIDEDSDFAKLITARQPAVIRDLVYNRENDESVADNAYTKEKLAEYFDDIVATRMATQNSTDLATADDVADIEFLTMLVDRFTAAKYGYHSRKPVSEKLAEVTGLKSRYDALNTEQQAEVLTAFSGNASGRSADVLVAFDEALDAVKAEAAALAYINSYMLTNGEYDADWYSNTTRIQEDLAGELGEALETLGLDIDEDSDFAKLITARQPAVIRDLVYNRENDESVADNAYTKEKLAEYFDDIVATRMATQNSTDLATADDVADIEFLTMLVDRFTAAKYGYHSRKPVSEKLAEVTGLKSRYDALNTEQQAEVLTAFSGNASGRSADVLVAFDEALDAVKAEAAALAYINSYMLTNGEYDADWYSNTTRIQEDLAGELGEALETLGLDIDEDSDFAKLITARQPAVIRDLVYNRENDESVADNAYTKEKLAEYFDDIVATRMATQNSTDLATADDVADIEFLTMLVDRFTAAKYGYHSRKPVSEKLAEVTGLKSRYDALNTEQQAEVLTAFSGNASGRSADVLVAFDEALDAVKAEAAALAYINSYMLTNGEYDADWYSNTTRIQEDLAGELGEALETLGLDIDEDSDFAKLITARQPAVIRDLVYNRENDESVADNAYTKEKLAEYFDDIVATRMATQNSTDLATADDVADIEFLTMLVDRFTAAKYGYHSRKPVSEKLAEVTGLKSRYDALNTEQQAEVLTAFSGNASGRSADVLVAFDEALDAVKAEAAALAYINSYMLTNGEYDADWYSNTTRIQEDLAGELGEALETLGLDIDEDSDFAKLITARQPAVIRDLVYNRENDESVADNAYTKEKLAEYFDDIVATRMATQNSTDLATADDVADIEFLTMLVDRFTAAKYGYHSRKPVSEKLAEVTGLKSRYDALNTEQQAEVLTAFSGNASGRSADVLVAFDEALDAVKAEAAALAYINSYMLTNGEYDADWYSNTTRIQEDLAGELGEALETLGLDIDEDSDFAKLITARQPAVIRDLVYNRENDESVADNAYTKEKLAEYFDDIVATRMATQNSTDLATADDVADIEFLTMLVDRFTAAKYGYHSRKPVSEKLAEVTGLKSRYDALNTEQQAEVLTAFSGNASGRSADVLVAFDEALDAVKAEAAALAYINSYMLTNGEYDADWYSNTTRIQEDLAGELGEALETLGLDIDEDSDFAKLITARQPAVIRDLVYNRENDESVADNAYTKEKLAEYFDDIVATRMATQNSTDLATADDVADIEFLTMLVDRFTAAKYGYHSRKPVSEKLAEVTGLKSRYDALNTEQQAEVLTAFSGNASGRSADVLVAFTNRCQAPKLLS